MRGGGESEGRKRLCPLRPLFGADYIKKIIVFFKLNISPLISSLFILGLSPLSPKPERSSQFLSLMRLLPAHVEPRPVRDVGVPLYVPPRESIHTWLHLFCHAEHYLFRGSCVRFLCGASYARGSTEHVDLCFSNSFVSFAMRVSMYSIRCLFIFFRSFGVWGAGQGGVWVGTRGEGEGASRGSEDV